MQNFDPSEENWANVIKIRNFKITSFLESTHDQSPQKSDRVRIIVSEEGAFSIKCHLD